MPGGFVGVDVFFVISGYVITAMLLRRGADRGHIGFADFYARRARRLMPALALLSVVVALGSMAALSPLGPQQVTARTGTAATLLVANVQLSRVGVAGYFDLAAEANAMLHTWSLSVEEQFYLVFPALLLVAWRLARRFPIHRSSRATLLAVVGLATAASFALSITTAYHGSAVLGNTFAFYSVASRGWEFGVGIILAVVAARARSIPSTVAVGGGVLGVALVVGAALVVEPSTAVPGLAATIPVSGAALLLVAGSVTGRGASAVLSLPPVTWIGDRSYGWYLWHWPLLVFTGALWPGRSLLLVAVAMGALLPAALSHRLLEQPLRVDDRLRGRRVLPLVAICVVVPLLAFQGLRLVGRVQRRSPAVHTLAVALRQHDDRVRGCDEPVPLGDRTGTTCTWSVDHPKGHIYLVGDSNAGQFTEPAARAANRQGYDLTVVTMAGCPFVDLVLDEIGGRFDGEGCNTDVNETVATLEARHPSLVVIASSSTEYVNGRRQVLSDPVTAARSSKPGAKAGLWEEGLRRVVAPLGRAGIPTVVIHTVPQFGATLGSNWRAMTCPALHIRDGSCGGARSRAGVVAEQALTRAAEDRAVRGVPLASTAELIDELCSPTTCATRRGDLYLYRDATHLTVDGASTLEPALGRLIARSARSARSRR